MTSSKPSTSSSDVNEKKISLPSQVTVVDDVAEDGKTVIVVSDDNTAAQKVKALVKKNRKVLVFVASVIVTLAVGRVVRSRSLTEDVVETEVAEEV